jgi:hypothetical protein
MKEFVIDSCEMLSGQLPGVGDRIVITVGEKLVLCVVKVVAQDEHPDEHGNYPVHIQVERIDE